MLCTFFPKSTVTRTSFLNTYFSVIIKLRLSQASLMGTMHWLRMGGNCGSSTFQIHESMCGTIARGRWSHRSTSSRRSFGPGQLLSLKNAVHNVSVKMLKSRQSWSGSRRRGSGVGGERKTDWSSAEFTISCMTAWDCELNLHLPRSLAIAIFQNAVASIYKFRLLAFADGLISTLFLYALLKARPQQAHAGQCCRGPR